MNPIPLLPVPMPPTTHAMSRRGIRHYSPYNLRSRSPNQRLEDHLSLPPRRPPTVARADPPAYCHAQNQAPQVNIVSQTEFNKPTYCLPSSTQTVVFLDHISRVCPYFTSLLTFTKILLQNMGGLGDQLNHILEMLD